MTTSTPASGDALSFAANIKPLFRDSDREAMKAAFDLWSVSDVRSHGEAIASAVRSGSMPCDGPWPEADVALFDRWLAEGSPE